MRQRLPRNLFITVKGIDFVSDFYEDVPFEGKVERESVVETVYNNNSVKVSLGKIDVIKKGWTDGLMRFRWNDNIIRFYGLQESKRDVKPTNTQITKQLLQILSYYTQLAPATKEGCKVFCLNSAYFIGYILKESILDLIEELTPIIENSGVSASKLYYNCKDAKIIVSNWVASNKDNCHIHCLDTKKEATKFKLNELYREIYKSCIE